MAASEFPHEFIAEDKTAQDGASMYRYTFSSSNFPDHSVTFAKYVTHQLQNMDYDHITIHCPDGHPEWLTKFFRRMVGYGIPAEVTPVPTDRMLLGAMEAACRHTPYRWAD